MFEFEFEFEFVFVYTLLFDPSILLGLFPHFLLWFLFFYIGMSNSSVNAGLLALGG